MAILKQYPIYKRSFYICSFLMLFAFAKVYSQRNSSDILFENSNVEVVDIFLETTIELAITTTKENQIKISESQGGEYKNAVLLSSKVTNDTLKITDPFNPGFNFPQDKLGAHKVLDGKALLYIPENLKLQITCRNCFLKVTGNYKKTFINLESGSCSLEKVTGDYHIISVHADVSINKPTSFIKASSKYGRINRLSKKENQNYNLKIETITAPITIKD